MKTSLLPLALLLALPLAASVGTGEDGEGGTWVITGHETCTDPRLVVARNVTVADGGVLDLKGCVLAMDSPPYVDQYFARDDEGLLLRVEKGGLLRLEAASGRPAGIERANASYGYTIQVYGGLVSTGLPGAPNVISGVEGAHEGQLALGGVRGAGNVTLRHTRFEENWGPSLFMVPGGRLDARDTEFAGWGGLVAVRTDSVRLANVTATARNTPLSISIVPEVVLEDCDVHGGRSAMYVTRANVTFRRCTVAGNLTAIQAVDANVILEDTTLRYGGAGLVLQRKSPTAHESRLTLRGSDVLGSGANATSAIDGTQATVDVRGGRLSSTKGPVINGSLLRLTVQDAALDGPQGIRVADPFELSVSGTTGPSPRVAIWRSTLVMVVDSAGNPLSGVNVTLPQAAGTTDEAGKALLLWHLESSDQASGAVDLGGTVELKVVDPATGKTLTQQMPEKLTVAQVTLSQGAAGWFNWWVVAALAALVVLAAVVAVKMRAKRQA